MVEPVRKLSFDQVVDRLLGEQKPYYGNYLAMYSSWYGGIVTDPPLMMVPIDDHLVHRGDGIFEAFRCVAGNLYGLERHLDRFERSARGAMLDLPLSRPQLVEIVLATVRAASIADCVVRVFVSRGPGGFSANPYECPAGQVYVVATRFTPPAREKRERGVSLLSSRIPAKAERFANIKNCNYLPNVLMKKEAVDAGVDFTISLDENGYIGEGGTENVGIITRQGEFLVPKFERVLRGVTVTRMMELAAELVRSGELQRVAEADIPLAQAYEAAEAFIFGTTQDVLPVRSYDGRTIGQGRPGAFFAKFQELLHEDMRTNPEMLTRVAG